MMGLGGGCAETKQQPEVLSVRQQLRDLSAVPVGTGYDRALEEVRANCFERDKPSTTPVNTWLASGFTINRSYEVVTKAKTALSVGVKVYGVDYSFGGNLSSQIRNTGEVGYFAMLAKFTSHTERAGAIKARANTPCDTVSNNGTANTVGEFVSVCGDATLAEKTYGGHILVAWRRDASTANKEESFGLNFGAKASDATIQAEVGLSKLVDLGFGEEELLIEVKGLPVPAPVLLPSGKMGYSVKSVLEYLNTVSTQASAGNISFLSVVDYKLERQQEWQMNLCIRANPGLTDPEWECVYNQMTELVANRDGFDGNGDSEREQLAAEFERHRLALTEYLPDGRLRFQTLTQDKCPNDDDGNPRLEMSGRCQAATLERFVNLYTQCLDASAVMLARCRDPILGDVNFCIDFKSQCTLPTITLANGTVVGCDMAGLTAAKNEVVPYTVLPPNGQPNPGGQFGPPLVLPFTDTPVRDIPDTKNMLCGLTGVRGWLHESEVLLTPVSGGNWQIKVTSSLRDPDKAVQVEVTCVSLDNFTHINGIASFRTPLMESATFPAANGGQLPAWYFLTNEGDPSLLGWRHYLSEPETFVEALGPAPTDFGRFASRDLFPLESVMVYAGTVVVRAKPGSSGFGGSPWFAYVDDRPMKTVGTPFGAPPRNTDRVSAALIPSDQGFCYLTSISGHFYNVNDWVGIDTSDGLGTLRTTTPVSKDRNPGAQAQCLLYDRL